MKPGLWELLILLVIILLLFGTKKLRNAGGDIGSAFKNFKKAVKDEDKQVEDKSKDADFESTEQSQKQNSAQSSEATDSKK